MSFIPRLPESAPFALDQRAWLDGYLAGLLGFETGLENPPPPPATAVSRGEELPWHDPTLSLEQRLTLAQGKPLERVLMAAMAQLDCGQCGYLCQTYAEAIARGEEKSLSRCAPGGKATSRKLKELVGTSSSTSAAGVATVSTPAPKPAPVRASDKPADIRFCEARPLNRQGSDRDTRHVVLAAGPGEMQYEVGDSLGIVARNSSELVAAIITCLGAARDTPVLSPDGIERPLDQALSVACEIRRPSDQAIEVLASRALDRDESLVLQAMAEGYPGAGPEDADLLDLLQGYPSARPPLSELISTLDPLQPRLYSIASSPKQVGAEIHLAVAAVRYEKRARQRLGVASTFLSDRLVPGQPVRAFVHQARDFRLPSSPHTPIIMIGPGTGVAPFRAFLQERRAIGAPGRNWLVFGNPHRDRDFLFEEELLGYRRDGLLTRLDTAFSRDQESKIYVQHRLLEHAGELWSWIGDGAHLYVCGDAQRMARDVEAGLTYIVGKGGRMQPAAAKAYLAWLTAEGRYQKTSTKPEKRMFLESVDQFAATAVGKAAFVRRSPLGFWISSMMAGAYVGLGIVLIFCVGANVDPGIRPIVMGASFGIALTLVIFAGSDLFTGHTMFMTLGWLRRRTSLRDLAVSWSGSWAGNLAGATVLAAIFVAGGSALGAKSQLLINVAAAKMNAPAVELLARAILCNWLVCLAIWTAARMTNDTAKCIAIFWCLYAFIASGFEHSVANMTLFSIALMAEHPASVTIGGMAWNLLWVTIGNIIGGAGIMGFGYWLASRSTATGEPARRLAAAE